MYTHLMHVSEFTRVCAPSPKGILTGSAVFAQHTRLTNTQADTLCQRMRRNSSHLAVALLAIRAETR